MLARESFDDLHLWHNGRTAPAGCSKRPPSKAAASEEARRTLRYVEPLSDARTKLADFFSILLVRHLLVIQPHMVSQFMDYRVADFVNDFRLRPAEA